MKLLFFDVDGTLLLTGGAGIRAMADAFEELFGVRNAFRDSTMAGRTDNWVLAHALTRHDVTPRPDDLARFSAVYVSHLRRQLDKPGPRKGIMPGVMSLLTVLQERNHTRISLLTGNYREGARAKLEYFNLWHHFTGGAFGDDVPERNLLLPVALAEAERDGMSFTLDEVVVIGDTPLDVAGALAGGVRSVAVATGEYDAEALRTAGADAVLEDFGDTPAVLKALGLN